MRTLRVFLAGLLATTLNASAVGPYHAPCEDQDESVQDALKQLKSCLDNSTHKKRPNPSEAPKICKKENEEFQEATRKFRECRTGPFSTPVKDSSHEIP